MKTHDVSQDAMRLSVWRDCIAASTSRPSALQGGVVQRRFRGQLFSWDFVLAVMVFLALFVALTLAWDNTLNFADSDQTAWHMGNLASGISGQLVRTAGYPSRWEQNPSGASVIGLAGHDRVLDNGKVRAFLGMDYAALKDLLKTEGYEFYFRLAGSGESLGMPPSGSSFALVRRMVSYMGTNETMEFYIWK